MKSKLSKSVLGVGIVVVVAAIAGFWWFTSRDAPEEATLDKAVAGLDSKDPGASTAEPGLADGTWKVDTKTGEFNYEEATGTFVGFRIKEELARLGSATAVGRTGGVEGSIVVAGNKLTAAEFNVDMASITTNDIRRDNKVQSALDIREFPTATFKLTSPVSLGSDPTDGRTIDVKAKGDLTIRGKTRSVEMPIQAKFVDGTIAVVGSTDIKFSDFGVEVPHSPVVLSVEDHGILELQLLFAR
ncbi:MAG TPA: YceI family protein [Microthrixaceae bacterium]|nr:YceI family protein [Microthrixaceae bacterium]